jgi:hypothetical protein
MKVAEQLDRLAELSALRRPLTGGERWEAIELAQKEKARARGRRWYHSKDNHSKALDRNREWKRAQRA